LVVSRGFSVGRDEGTATTNPEPTTNHEPLTTNRGSLIFLVAVLYLAAHVPSLAPSLEDIDSINFALGLRHFDPALHQPHPPGYPVYMVLGHISLPIVERVTSATGVAAEARALAIWSAIGGAGCILAVWFLFAALRARLPATDSRLLAGPETRSRRSEVLWAPLLLAASPLFWMTGLRPMSDMPGLALAVAAQALLLAQCGLEARRGPGERGGPFGSAITGGALLAGLATGIRVQSAVLTLPLLAFVIVEQRRFAKPLLAFAIGCLTWGIPLLIASGGVGAYIAALNMQAVQDFSWVDMLWSNPTPGHIAIGLYQALVLPWASIPLAAAVGVAAAIGVLVSLLREPRVLLVLAVAFGPYFVFHLLFQQLDTTRYALPIVIPVGWLAARGFALAGRLTPMVAAPLVAAALIVAVPGGVAYGRDPHPAFRAIADAVQRARVQPPAAVYSHYAIRRPLQAADTGALHVVEPVTQYEWLGPVNYWRNGGADPIWFFADARRTDLALIDPHSRSDVVRYRWTVEQRGELSGTRPLGVDWYRLGVPGWFAGQGWSLTPEIGGLTQATSMGPDHRPIEAWVRRRPGPFHAVVGARHLGGGADADAEMTLAVDGHPIARWPVTRAARNALQFVDLPDGIPGAGPFATLTITSRSVDPKRSAPVAVRQFDVQPSAQLVTAFAEGWHEAEYSIETGLTWRWTSERSVLRINGPAQPVTLEIAGESPLRYFDRPPTVKITAGDVTLAQFQPDTDFEWRVAVPAEAMLNSGGAIAIEIDRVYLPGKVEGTADDRHLGLRIFDLRVNGVDP
jgi:transmembrane protein TMEM260 (protein O-mannosyltransferase)